MTNLAQIALGLSHTRFRGQPARLPVVRAKPPAAEPTSPPTIQATVAASMCSSLLGAMLGNKTDEPILSPAELESRADHLQAIASTHVVGGVVTSLLTVSV